MGSKQTKQSNIKRVFVALFTIALTCIMLASNAFAFSTSETGNISAGKIWGRFFINTDPNIIGQATNFTFATLPALYPYENVKSANKPYDRYTYFPTPDISGDLTTGFTPVASPYKLNGRVYYKDGTARRFDQIFIGVETAGSGGTITTTRSFASLYYQGKQIDVLFNVSSYVSNKVVNTSIDYLSFGTREQPSTWWETSNVDEYASLYLRPTFAFFSTTVTNPVSGKIYFNRNQEGALIPITSDTGAGGTPSKPSQSENGFTAFSNYIFSTFQEILDIEFFGYFTIGDLVGTLLAIMAVLVFLKFYAGG